MQEEPHLKHFYLFTYSLAPLSQKAKVKAIRGLLGYKNKKQKLYEHDGLLQEHSGEKIAQNVLLLPAEKAVPFVDYFRENKIPYSFKELWMKE
ncbi:hypothetical protein HYU14_00785 [Candidatus Woesearchaeota archaeon]|nr:hypothetical protein [Candidatus Woesearchaeota archaeon]